jgi:small GTP-binding protein
MSEQTKRVKTYKLIVIGETRSGKTSFYYRAIHGTYTDNLVSTIGVDFGVKRLSQEDGQFDLRYQLWDTAGQERFRNISPMFYRYVQGCFITFDITDFDSFEKVDKWITLKGFLDSNKVHIDTLAIVNDFDVQLGQEKDGWFKKKNVVIIQSKNPHTKIDSIKPYVFPEKKKWYQRDGWKIIGTALLTSYLFIR